MEWLLTLPVILIINAIIGAAVCATFDTKDRVFYNWFKDDPTGGIVNFLILTFWPVMLYFMISYRLDSRGE